MRCGQGRREVAGIRPLIVGNSTDLGKKRPVYTGSRMHTRIPLRMPDDFDANLIVTPPAGPLATVRRIVWQTISGPPASLFFGLNGATGGSVADEPGRQAIAGLSGRSSEELNQILGNVMDKMEPAPGTPEQSPPRIYFAFDWMDGTRRQLGRRPPRFIRSFKERPIGPPRRAIYKSIPLDMEVTPAAAAQISEELGWSIANWMMLLAERDPNWIPGMVYPQELQARDVAIVAGLTWTPEGTYFLVIGTSAEVESAMA